MCERQLLETGHTTAASPMRTVAVPERHGRHGAVEAVGAAVSVLA